MYISVNNSLLSRIFSRHITRFQYFLMNSLALFIVTLGHENSLLIFFPFNSTQRRAWLQI